MSKMSELAMEIEELYLQGYNEFTIATMLNIPVELVDNFVASFMEMNMVLQTQSRTGMYLGG